MSEYRSRAHRDATKRRSKADAVLPAGSAKTLLDRSIARVRRRLIPFLLLMYVVAFLDRTNIAFAKEALQKEVSISATAYALGAGLFFVSYALFEIPSNLILHRVGAKLWMARIMVSWGLVSVATLLVRGDRSFYLLRLLLGATEAGFFPGVILYLTYWFPARVRGQVLGLFYIGAPLAFIFGGPISGFLLAMHPVSPLRNWQWMFLLEGLLAVGVGTWSYWYLDDEPTTARWLPPEEKLALTQALQEEPQDREDGGVFDSLPMLCDVRLVHFTLVYFLIQMSVYSAVFYLPSEISAILRKPTGWQTGVVSAIPWLCALSASYWLPRLADHTRTHRSMSALALALAGMASAVFPFLGAKADIAALSVAVSGLIAVQPIFWTFPTSYLSDRAAAAGLALINMMGNLGGFLAPNVRVWGDRYWHSPVAGSYVLSGFTFAGALLCAGLRNTGTGKAAATDAGGKTSAGPETRSRC